jgi:hypothetical protein
MGGLETPENRNRVGHSAHGTSHRSLSENDHVDPPRQLFESVSDLRVMSFDVPVGEELKRSLNKHIVDHNILALLCCQALQQIHGRHKCCAQGRKDAYAVSFLDSGFGHAFVDTEQRHGAKRRDGINCRSESQTCDDNRIRPGVDC